MHMLLMSDMLNCFHFVFVTRQTTGFCDIFWHYLHAFQRLNYFSCSINIAQLQL